MQKYRQQRRLHLRMSVRLSPTPVKVHCQVVVAVVVAAAAVVAVDVKQHMSHPAYDPPKKRGRPPKPKNVPEASITELSPAGVSDQFADAVTDNAEVDTDDETDPVSLPPPTKRRRGRPRKNPQPTAVLTAPHSDTHEQIKNDDEDMDDDGQSIALSDLCFPLAKRRAGRPAGLKPCYLYKYTTSQKYTLNNGA